MQEVTFRSAKEADIEMISHLVMQANLFSSLVAVKNWTAKNISNFPQFHFVALIENQIVGTIGATTEQEQMTIVDLSVANNHKDEKIGSKLLAILLDAAYQSGILTIRAWVHKTNFTAIPFYHSHGFSIVNHFEARNITGVADGEKFLLLEKNLDE